MNLFNSVLFTAPLPAYMKLALTEEKELVRLATYAMKIKSFERKLNHRFNALSKAYASGDKSQIISALRDSSSGISPKELSRLSGVPLITCRRDLNKLFDMYRIFHVYNRMGKIKSPDVPSIL